MKKFRMFEIVYSDFKLLNGLRYREIDTIKLSNNDVMMINRNEKSNYNETDFYTLLGIQLNDEELVDELKFKVTITYK
jgi:hypothetical protein